MTQIKKLIIFIHGLNGNKKSWGHFPDLILNDKDLSKEFEVNHFEYKTNLIGFPFTSKISKLQDLAAALATEIKTKYSDYDQIILICHSMGGLIAKKYILDDYKKNNNSIIKKIVLFSCPNNGAFLAYFGSILNIFRHHLPQLKSNSDFIDQLQEDWYTFDIESILPVRYIFGLKDRVVNKLSAKGIWGNQQFYPFKDKGHIDIIKPQSSEDEIFLYTKKILLNRDEVSLKRFDDYLTECKLISDAKVKKQVELKKYIPNLFTEISDIKEVGRYFAAPSIFVKKLLDDYEKIDFEKIEKFLGEFSISFIKYRIPDNLKEKPLSIDYTDYIKEIKTYIENVYKELESFEKNAHNIYRTKLNIPELKLYEFSAQKYKWESFYPYRIKIEKLIKQLEAVIAKVIIVTSKAGRGKTNFVCDFVENVLSRRDIPNLLYFGSELKNIAENNFIEEIFKIDILKKITCNKNVSILELNRWCEINGKLFVLIIDGINESNNIRLFAERLYDLTVEINKYKNIKLILTSRSEYFDARFGRFNTLISKDDILILADYDNLIEPKNREQLFEIYQNHFRYRILKYSDEVFQKITSDTLFLRIFSETYGDPKSNEVQVIPELYSLYKENIFTQYINKKFNLISDSRQDDSMLGTRGKLLFNEILLKLVDYILDNLQDTDMSIAKLGLNYEQIDEFDRFIDEDIVLRRDPSEKNPLDFDEKISFTFDEFRDYLIARHLVEKIFFENPDEFNFLIDKIAHPGIKISEGTLKFVFYFSKKMRNAEMDKILKSKKWYDLLFIYEIFNVDDDYIDKVDINKVTNMFVANVENAKAISIRLMRRGQIRYYKNLNLEILINIIASLNEEQYEKIIERLFSLEGEKYYYKNNYEINLAPYFNFLSSVLKHQDLFKIEHYSVHFKFILLLYGHYDSEISYEIINLFEVLAKDNPALTEQIILEDLDSILSNPSLKDNILNMCNALIHYQENFSCSFKDRINLENQN